MGTKDWTPIPATSGSGSPPKEAIPPWNLPPITGGVPSTWHPEPAPPYNWRGSWAIDTGYMVNDVVEDNTHYYVCMMAHVSAEDNQPTEVNGPTYWTEIFDFTPP